MALATNCKFICSITSKVFRNVKYICLQKLATDSTQHSSKGKSSPPSPNPKEQQKDVAGLSSSVYTTPSHDPNQESNNRITSPDPNSPSSVEEHGNLDPNSPSSNTKTKENDASFLPDVNYTGNVNNLALQSVSRKNTDITPPVNEKFIAGHLPQNIVDSFYSKPSKDEANLNKVSHTIPDVHDHKLLLMSVELGVMPESVQLLCSKLTPCKQATKIHKINDADSIKNLVTNIEDQCKLLNGVCESDYNKLFLVALELGSIPQGLQTFFNEHFFVNNLKSKENDVLSKESTQLTENVSTEEKFSDGVTSILSLQYGDVPRIFDEYLNMSNNVGNIIQHTASQAPQHLHNEEAQKINIFENTPSTTQRLHEGETSPFDKTASVKENHSSTFSSFYSNTTDIIDSIGDEIDDALEPFPIKNKPITKPPLDIVKASGVFGMTTPRCIDQLLRDPNHEINPKMTNPAPNSPYSILTEESVGQPSPSIQPEETCKHCLLSAQHAPGVVKEVPITLSQPHIDNLVPSLTENEKSSTDAKKSVPEQSDDSAHEPNIENMKVCHLIAELGILSKRTILYCSTLSSCSLVIPPKLKSLLEQQELSKKCCLSNLFLLMLESGILPVGTDGSTITFKDIHDSTSQHIEKSAEAIKGSSVNYTHKPDKPTKIKNALIPWKSAPNCLMIRAKETSLVPVVAKPISLNIAEFIKSNTQDFLQKEKRKDLHIFEIPLHNEDSTEINKAEYNNDANLCDSKNNNVYNDVDGLNTSIPVPRDDVQQDNVNNIKSTKSDLCNEAQTFKSYLPAVRMEISVSNYMSFTKNSDHIPEPVLSRKQEINVLNDWGTVDNIKSQAGPHTSQVKVKDEHFQAHQQQETDCVTQRETITLHNLKMLAEINNNSEYTYFTSNIIENPEKKVQKEIQFKISAKSDDLKVPLGNINNVKYNVVESESTIVSPIQAVKEKESPIVSPTVMLPTLNTNDTFSSSCVRKEIINKKFASSEQLLPLLDTNDTLSVYCNIGKEEANNKTFVDSLKKTVLTPILNTDDTLSIFYIVGNKNLNFVSPEKTVMPPVLDTNDTLSVSCNLGKEETNIKLVGSYDQLPPIIDTNDTHSISCIVEQDKTNKTLVVPAIDTNTFSCNEGKEKSNNQNLVVAFGQTVKPPVLDTKDTLSISCNVEKEKVENLVLDENVASTPDKSIVSVFYANLCMNPKKVDSNKHTHMNKENTASTNKSNNAEECLNFTDKAQRSIEAIVKAVTDKYNNSLNKFSANTSKSDDCPPSEVETSVFHMGDIFKQHIWKPFTFNIWKMFGYSNNINQIKSDFPQKLEICDLEVSNKLNSQFLLAQINKNNVFMTSKYKYFTELCSEPFAIHPKLKLGSVLKEDVKVHIEKCSTEITGPSSSVFVVCDGEVGPGASKSGEYKNPEYFSYHKESYFEAEVEMLKYRLPQPSSREK